MDLFTRARLKITFLYFLLGIVIIAVAGYFVYSDVTAVVKNVLQIVEELLAGQIPVATAAAVISHAINAQIRQMDIAVGLWLILAMVLAAYLLAGITLRPVKRAMERQRRFMANISHELRTPVSIMKANTEATLLAGEQMTRDELAGAVRNTLEELDRMTKIIEFLLDFSDVENRLTRQSFRAVDLAHAAKKTVGLMARTAAEKRVDLRLAARDKAIISGNATAIEEMIMNLVKNAIAYTAPGGSVTVIVSKKFGKATLSVKDTGIGIPQRDIANIFEAFYRGDNVVSIKDTGSIGLGLAIVKEIATFHGAIVSVKSEIGIGTTMSVQFPGRLSRWVGALNA